MNEIEMNQKVKKDDHPFEINNNSNLTKNEIKPENNQEIKLATNQVDKTDLDIQTKPPKFKVPPSLWKTFICSLALFIVGSVLIGIGFIDSVAAADPGHGITFWTIGSIIFIPGAFYSYKFWKAKRSKTEDQRQEIYDQIPEL
jgi:hypothetical protein